MLRCPAGFDIVQSQGCYIKCPSDLGFVQTQKDGSAPSCVFRDQRDESTTILREQVPFLPAPKENQPIAPTLDQVKDMHPSQYQSFASEASRFDAELKAVLQKLDQKKIVDLAFQKLQDAEQSRDTAPEAYIAARNAYYTLTKGDMWADQERRRIEAAEVVPVLRQVMDKYTDATNRVQTSSKLVDMINNVQQNVSGIQDEFKGTVNLLGKQVRNVQDQLNFERHKTEEKKPVVLPFVGYILNALLAIAGLFAVVKVFSAFASSGNPYSSPIGAYET